MASSIVSPSPRSHHAASRHPRKELLDDDGRDTPLPQYEKTQSRPVPAIHAVEGRPGRYIVTFDVDISHQPHDSAHASPLDLALSTKLAANLNHAPSRSHESSSQQPTKHASSPPSPHESAWSELGSVPPDFIQNVVPDWQHAFSRSASTASTQSKRLSDIKARIKKGGRVLALRLLKGAGDDKTEDEVEVPLGTQGTQMPGETQPGAQELDSVAQAAELDTSPAVPLSTPSHPKDSDQVPANVFEIGTSGEPGVNKPLPSPTPTAAGRISAIPQWLSQASCEAFHRHSVLSDGFSDAETLLPDVRSISEQHEEQTDLARLLASAPSLTRADSTTSIVKTPTRGLSIVGPARRVEKRNSGKKKGKQVRRTLSRSDANKVVKRPSPSGSIDRRTSGSNMSHNPGSSASGPEDQITPPTQQSQAEPSDAWTSDESGWEPRCRERSTRKPKLNNRSVSENLLQPPKQKSTLRLQTNVPRPKSTETSPTLRKRKSPRGHKPSSSSSSLNFGDKEQKAQPASTWSEVSPSAELRKSLEQALGSLKPEDPERTNDQASQSIPKIEEPVDDSPVGGMPLPEDLDFHAPISSTKNPLTTFWGLAFNAMSEKLSEGFQALNRIYGPEPPIPTGHVRVRWTCACGEQLFDDFIERKPGAARWLEAYLNRRTRSHSPNSSTSQSSTATSMSSIFSSGGTASNLTTPSSTHGGGSWGRGSDASKHSPVKLGTGNPFSVRTSRLAPESWLLTCANEGRFTPKLVHLDVNEARVRSDKDFALSLREHYEQLNGKRWFSWLRLRGLTTMEFVQFEVHRNRFADIRAAPAMPPSSASSSSAQAASPSHHPYNFEPVDLLPPVGSTYLLHLFRHPSDYDGEVITYLRSPKRRERLEFGLGWGINLVEGFMASKVWALVTAMFGVGSGVFAVLWTVKTGDVQGAFGVASWVVSLAVLVVAGMQAWLD